MPRGQNKRGRKGGQSRGKRGTGKGGWFGDSVGHSQARRKGSNNQEEGGFGGLL